jgi:hypothetical protein
MSDTVHWERVAHDENPLHAPCAWRSYTPLDQLQTAAPRWRRDERADEVSDTRVTRHRSDCCSKR